MERLRLPLASLVFLLLYCLFVCFFLRVKSRKLSRDSCYSSNVPDTTAAVRDGFSLVQERFLDNQTRVQVEISLQVAVAMES